jgi:hypothetical protein
MRRAAATVALLAAATAALWLVVFPADWSSVPTADPLTFASPLSAAHWTTAAAGLAVLAFTGGYARGPGAALLGVAAPAAALYCYRSATAEVVGANLWVVGALLVVPAIAAGVAVAAGLGRAARRGGSAV